MRKATIWMLIIMVVGISFVLVACGSPEQTLIRRYLDAVKMNDKDTMSKMAYQPVKILFKKWKIESVTEPVEEPLKLKDLAAKLVDLKDQLEKAQEKAAEAQIDLEDYQKLYDKWPAWRKRAKKKEYEAKKAAFEEAKNEFLKIQSEYKNVQAELNKEKRLLSLSVGDIQNVENMDGKVLTKTLILSGITPDGNTKKYKVTLKRYIISKPGTNITIRGRWVILTFESIS